MVRMAITKEKKRDIVAKLSEALKGAQSVAFVGFTKFTVSDASKLRAELSKEKVRYMVAKKTLLKRVLSGQGYAGTMPDMPGEVAIAWTDEADNTTAPMHSVYDFGKKMKGALTLLGGVFEHSFSDAAYTTAIATIPPLPVLRGMFVNVVNSPLQGLVIALDKIREARASA